MGRLEGDGGMPGARREFPGNDASQHNQIDQHPCFTGLEPPAESWPFQGHESNVAAAMVHLELPQIIRNEVSHALVRHSNANGPDYGLTAAFYF